MIEIRGINNINKKEGKQPKMTDEQMKTDAATKQQPAGNGEQGNESMNVSNDDGQEDGEEELDQQFDNSDDSPSQASLDDEQTFNAIPKRVRSNLATIRIPEPAANEPIIFSYHYKYEKYLRDRNLIDPEKAKLIEDK